jgi:hypothetical protein
MSESSTPHLADHRDSIPSRGMDFCFFTTNVQTGSEAHPAFCPVDTGGSLIRSESGRSMKLITHLRLMLRLRIRGVIPTFFQYIFMA